MADLLLGALRMEKETFWIEHSQLLPAVIEALWARRVSEITSVGKHYVPMTCRDSSIMVRKDSVLQRALD